MRETNPQELIEEYNTRQKLTDRERYQMDCEQAEREQMSYREYTCLRSMYRNKRADNPLSQALTDRDFEKYLWVRRQYLH